MDVLLEPGSAEVAALAALLDPARLDSSARGRLVYGAALHDIGKTNLPFQDLGRGSRGRSEGHVRVLLRSAPREPVQSALRALFGVVPDNELDSYFKTVVCHHGRAWQIYDAVTSERAGMLWDPDPASGREPLAEWLRIAKHARSWARLADDGAARIGWTSAASHLFAGLLTLADWIGSNRLAFPLDPGADDDPETYWMRACDQARAACRSIGLRPPRRTLPSNLYRALFPSVFVEGGARPTPLQEVAATMPLPEAGSRVIIESDTGSGKTEAVLALYTRLRAAGLVRGLVFALPTRATSRAMYERVQRSVEATMADDVPTMALAIGGVEGEATGSSPIATDETRDQFPDDADELRHWCTESAKRYLAAEVVVGTVDQVLLAGLPVRHAHLRLSLLQPHLIVIDEVHSHDRYMTTVLRNLLDLHGRAGGIAILLSATLSAEGRARYGTDAVPAIEEAAAYPYPAVSVAPPGEDWRTTPAGSAGRERLIQWEPSSEEASVAAAVHAAAAGARVCILRNTVRDARRTVDQLRAANAPVWSPDGVSTPPYHSRYTPPDRTVLDERVRADFGRGGSGGAGAVLVATQVVEQSLDVDFDLLVTDLCPVDVLLQRVGRLHRHPERVRPAGYGQPHVLVVAPAEGFRDAGRRGAHGWGVVYEDLIDLELTLDLIRGQKDIMLPQENRRLVEYVYHPARRQPFQEDPAWAGRWLQREGARAGERSLGRQNRLDFSIDYGDVDFDDVRPRTRLGDPSLRFALDEPVPGWFGGSWKYVDVPLRKLREAVSLRGADPPIAELFSRSAEEHCYRLPNGAVVKYAPAGWYWPGE